MAGQIVHFEIPAGDTARAKEFWGSLFGWSWDAMDGPFEYHMTRVTDESGAAVFPADGSARGTRTYFSVDDINASTARVKELGGSAEDAQPVPGMGWFAYCNDSEGNAFGLWQTDPSAPAPGA
jgi:uncharacterized protein